MTARSTTALLLSGLTMFAPVVGRGPAHAAASSATPVSVNLTAGGTKLACKRKGGSSKGQVFFKVTFKIVFVSSVSAPVRNGSTPAHQKVDLKVKLTGNDAAIASLLYPVVFLGDGNGALDALHGQGYDVEAVDLGSTLCQDVLPAQTCTDLATQVAKTIGATLDVGDASELNPFLDGVSNLGFPTCPVT